MCRQNLLYGGCLFAFGMGVLIGTWMKTGLICYLFGIGLMTLGICIIRRR